jgi:hypothetical protein
VLDGHTGCRAEPEKEEQEVPQNFAPGTETRKPVANTVIALVDYSGGWGVGLVGCLGRFGAIMEDHGLRSRQLDEVDALEAIFGCEGEGCFSANEGEEEGMLLLRSMLDSCAASPGDFDTQAPGIPQTISIRIERGQQGGERHTVRLTLPCKYPLEVAKCSVEWDAGTRAQRDYINGALSQFASSMAGEEMCYALASKAEELIEEEARDMEEARQVHAALSCCVDEGGFHHHGGRGGGALRMKRVLIFFHHIIAAGKREAVQQWAVELKLGGYSKVRTMPPQHHQVLEHL